jgi:UDP-N-acetylmuramoyl-L-alanyl-D-glutamate--2,6-diaminopimelate ligase
MRLADLVEGLPMELARGDGDVRITAVVDDSRRAQPGAIFVARSGTASDGAGYIHDAVARGASAVVTAPGAPTPPPAAAHLVAPAPALAVALLAERLCGDPSRALALVGVTGTNGKTTLTFLIQQILARAGLRCGRVGTVGGDDGSGGALADWSGLTTPGAPECSALLRIMVERGCRAAAMEVSSHALEQGRVAALRFAGAVFTNLTGDHLDYHATMDAYLAAKARLFQGLDAGAFAVVNGDDPAGAEIARRCRALILRTTIDARAHGGAGPGEPCRARIAGAAIDGTDVRLTGPWGACALRLPLVGRHNVMNALQAAAAAHALGADAEAIAAALGHATAPPGRLESVTMPGRRGNDPIVLVDYAHTDDALENALGAVRPLVPAGGRLLVVFGCGGDRDRTKRPRMAAAAWRWADEVTVTSDNPRTEDPERIIDDVMAGVPPEKRARTARVADRRAAIEEAVARARAGDVVVIAGKGHEDYQIVGHEKRPFDDRRVAAAALAARSGAGREAAAAR